MNKKQRMQLTLGQNEIKIVRDLVQEEDLGDRGFSAALRRIIREWEDLSSRKSRRNNSGSDVTSED